MVETGAPALNRSRETRANTQSGYLMLFIWLLLLGVAAWAGITNANAEFMVAWKWIVVVASAIVGLLILCGFYLINPKIGRAHVCTPVHNAHLVCRLLLEKTKTIKKTKNQWNLYFRPLRDKY